jgi:ribonuclease R
VKKKKKKLIDPQAEREALRYVDPIPSREYILSLFDKEQTLTRRKIADRLSLSQEDALEALRRRLKAMVRDRQLNLSKEGYALKNGPQKVVIVEGRLKIERDGTGTVWAKDSPKLSKSQRIRLGASVVCDLCEGDKVQVRCVGHGGYALLQQVIDTVPLRLLGEYQLSKTGEPFIRPRSLRHSQPIPVIGAGSLEPGTWILVEIQRCPKTRVLLWRGEFVYAFGTLTPLALESQTIIERYHLPHVFSQDLIAACSQLPSMKEASLDPLRKDLRTLPLITIDGEDARDFDDAVCAEPKKEGGFRLWVAIADVSYYVRPGDIIDKEARKRGTSVYFPQEVIPMLPALLSEKLCSLMPHQERLALVCEATISSKGVVEDTQFYRALISSHARYTYTEVADHLQDAGAKIQHAALFHLEALFDILYQQRLKRGAIEFEGHETRICFNEEGEIDKILPVHRNKAHRIIEECMLLANEAAAQFLLHHQQPTLFRVHEGPKEEKLLELQDYLKLLGLSLGTTRDPMPKDYAKLVHSIQDRPDRDVIQLALLRSLSQAVYAPQKGPHFGLAYEAYVHFTSPIRRYPDLIVHRGIIAILEKKTKDGLPKESWTLLGEYCSMVERRADDSSREVVNAMKCHYMHTRLGETFSARVTGITHFGVFAEIEELYVEGLIHISSLGNDYYHYDALRCCLTGERTGEVIRCGDLFSIRVARVDILERKIDFERLDTR